MKDGVLYNFANSEPQRVYHNREGLRYDFLGEPYSAPSIWFVPQDNVAKALLLALEASNPGEPFQNITEVLKAVAARPV